MLAVDKTSEAARASTPCKRPTPPLGVPPGQPCRAPAVPGWRVCRMHGSWWRAKYPRANEGILILSDPNISEFKLEVVAPICEAWMGAAATTKT
jgi:hypothetical protein